MVYSEITHLYKKKTQKIQCRIKLIFLTKTTSKRFENSYCLTQIRNTTLFYNDKCMFIYRVQTISINRIKEQTETR